MRISAWIHVALVTSIHFSMAVNAASVCNDTHTIDDCFNAIGAESAADSPKYEELSNTEVFNQRHDLSIATTGDVTLNAFGSPVSLNDFLSLLNLSVDPGTGDDNSAQIALEYSPQTEWLEGDFKFGLAATRPSATESIKMAISDPGVVDALENDLEVSDDVSLSLSYAYIGDIGGIRFGRSDRLHQNLLDSIAFNALEATRRSKMDRLYAIKLENSLNQQYGLEGGETFGAMRVSIATSIKSKLTAPDLDFINAFLAASDDGTPLEQVHAACKTVYQSAVAGSDVSVSSALVANCVVDELVVRMESDAKAEVSNVAEFRKELTAGGFFKVAGLINNQPQFVVAITGRSRDKLAGGDKLGVGISLEFDMSGHNVNNLDRYLKKKCWSGAVSDPSRHDYQGCAGQIANYIEQNPVKPGGWRITANLNYERTDAVDISFPGTTETFSEEEAKSLKFSLVSGRQFSLVTEQGLPRAKLDIGASYEDISDDPMRQDRAMVNFTFTQELAKATQLSIGLVWANKAEFVGDVDEELSARLGLNYKFGMTGQD